MQEKLDLFIFNWPILKDREKIRTVASLVFEWIEHKKKKASEIFWPLLLQWMLLIRLKRPSFLRRKWAKQRACMICSKICKILMVQLILQTWKKKWLTNLMWVHNFKNTDDLLFFVFSFAKKVGNLGGNFYSRLGCLRKGLIDPLLTPRMVFCYKIVLTYCEKKLF